MAEGGGLLNRYTIEKSYRGFESLSLRQTVQCEPAHSRRTENEPRSRSVVGATSAKGVSTHPSPFE